MNTGFLVSGPIKQDTIAGLLEKTGTMTDSGGHSIFLGQVRADIEGGRAVKAIEYSAYEGMVAREAERIRKLIFSEFDDVTSIEIVHSTGLVMAGEISLLVLVSAGHRHQAMEACSRTVELIKEHLPVWKKEIFDDESYAWK